MGPDQALMTSESMLPKNIVTGSNNNNARSQNVYNPTTIPILRQSSKNYSPILSETSSLATVTTDGGNSETAGDPNELGIPRTSIHRWLPKTQRNLLQKQAELFVKPAKTPTKKVETDIF